MASGDPPNVFKDDEAKYWGYSLLEKANEISERLFGPVENGIARNSAGVLEINNGTAGTMREVKVTKPEGMWVEQPRIPLTVKSGTITNAYGLSLNQNAPMMFSNGSGEVLFRINADGTREYADEDGVLKPLPKANEKPKQAEPRPGPQGRKIRLED